MAKAGPAAKVGPPDISGGSADPFDPPPWLRPWPERPNVVWCGRSGSWNAETEVRTERLKLRESVYFQETEGFIGGARVGLSDGCYVGTATASV